MLSALDKPMAERESRGGRARRDFELREDVAHVTVDRLLAERELGGNLPIRAAGCHEPQHLKLARRESVLCTANAGRRARSEGVEMGQIRRRLETLERRPRELELQRGAVLVAKRASRDTAHAAPARR